MPAEPVADLLHRVGARWGMDDRVCRSGDPGQRIRQVVQPGQRLGVHGGLVEVQVRRADQPVRHVYRQAQPRPEVRHQARHRGGRPVAQRAQPDRRGPGRRRVGGDRPARARREPDQRHPVGLVGRGQHLQRLGAEAVRGHVGRRAVRDPGLRQVTHDLGVPGAGEPPAGGRVA
ncbi:hypothetical protein GCM10007977_001270 [Dactylosporangium sucinum]|uniref:Uncharacterized protein n=1 Tax=Dactylosporangium sucinum TaxID=1424081 RepID=A0A917SZC3_9ACTN|nr:hypothetical protein GCM10007977_001270 [Dactylosporangium sucinum]